MICRSSGLPVTARNSHLRHAFHLLDESRAKQRVQRERGIAQPAETVVPIAAAADLFRQRRGTGGHDAACLAVRQSLQRQQ